MRYLHALIIAMMGILSAFSQQEITLTSTNGTARVTCLSHTPGTISKIVSAEINGDQAQDTFHMRYQDIDGLVLHVAPYDTAFYVSRNGIDYYFHESGILPRSEWFDELGCLYGNIAYPPIAREKSISGTVLLDIYLDQTGCVQDIMAKTQLGYELEENAMQAFRDCSCQWSAATWGGIRQPTYMRLPVSYRLR